MHKNYINKIENDYISNSLIAENIKKKIGDYSL